MDSTMASCEEQQVGKVHISIEHSIIQKSKRKCRKKRIILLECEQKLANCIDKTKLKLSKTFYFPRLKKMMYNKSMKLCVSKLK
ncbi:hypothetical protein VNO80_13769 [Phaseolus coccineus]|uniref:Uncharacterized protein n=1 Tax=Phaseolus coccineus TaxID=3886 RepID=A0AAN9N7A2_PHACN